MYDAVSINLLAGNNCLDFTQYTLCPFRFSRILANTMAAYFSRQATVIFIYSAHVLWQVYGSLNTMEHTCNLIRGGTVTSGKIWRATSGGSGQNEYCMIHSCQLIMMTSSFWNYNYQQKFSGFFSQILIQNEQCQNSNGFCVALSSHNEAKKILNQSKI